MTSVKLWRHKGGWRSMANNNEYKYCVVEFLQKPPSGAGKYVCVPSSWIKTRRETDQKVIVQYPNCNKAERENLISRHEQGVIPMKWPEYLCELKYNTESRDDAKIYIMMKQIDDTKKGRCQTRKKAATRTAQAHNTYCGNRAAFSSYE
ncbi:uncharacterized protein LOC115439740 [Manduca sexta]|uniref:uncharacterized protein LOC115439740 n=1 Tax=Manduca sexta TaxID=7130 RepID=UPI0018900A3A|nr:uncharacterized protein LOC115439740 [Manduca sexta]